MTTLGKRSRHMRAWLATFVRRWHCNPHMSHTADAVGYHGGRMAVLALTLWGEKATRELLAACVLHDLGESVTGDIPWGAKQDETLASALRRMEERALADLGFHIGLSAQDRDRLKLLDRLDAYLWARHHAPWHVAEDADWRQALGWIETEMERLK